MPKGIDKGNGLLRYANSVGIAMKNIISFGDNENDNTLLEMSGWGVCLKEEKEKTKKLADDITDYSCVDGGVGHYLMDRCMNAKLCSH